MPRPSPADDAVQPCSGDELVREVARTEQALKVIEGRWKMLILYHLFRSPVLRFSELERAIPAVTQKMLIQQLRELEKDGVVLRVSYPQVPPRVEYALTPLGRALCPAIAELVQWAKAREQTREAVPTAAC